MKTVKEYIDCFLTLYSDKTEEVTEERRKDGEDVTSVEAVQSIREEAYYYFSSDEYAEAVGLYTWADTQVGKILLEEGLDPDKALNTYMEECGEEITRKEQEIIAILKNLADGHDWLIICNKSDCGDLSVYRSFGTEEGALKEMVLLMLKSAGTAGPGMVSQMLTNGREGYIRYIDEEREDFRIIPLDTVTPVTETDAVRDILECHGDYDVVPTDIDWDTEAADYALHDIGRE